jgi:hypothetical protein
MADLNSTSKVRTYHIIYRLNLSFSNIVVQCHLLRELGILHEARRYQSFVQELQAEINHELMQTLESKESHDLRRFGKVREAWEKDLRDPNDVFFQAEERRKELAKHRRKNRASARKKKSPR